MSLWRCLNNLYFFSKYETTFKNINNYYLYISENEYKIILEQCAIGYSSKAADQPSYERSESLSAISCLTKRL